MMKVLAMINFKGQLAVLRRKNGVIMVHMRLFKNLDKNELEPEIKWQVCTYYIYLYIFV